MKQSLRKVRFLLESYPCLTALLGLLNGLSGFYLFPENCSAGKLCLAAVPGLLLAWGIAGLQISCRKFIPFVILGILSSLIHLSCLDSDYSFELGPTGKRGADAVFRLKDSSLCGGKLPGVKNAPFYIQAELLGLVNGETEKTEPFSGNVLLTVSPGSEDLETAGYADIVRCSGFFERPQHGTMSGTFDFATYAAARGSFLVFHAETFETEQRGTGILRDLYDFRSRFLTDLLSGMKTDRAKEMAPALFFGIRQTITRDVKNDFLISGTLHILSVSGFHIGIFFLAVMLFFRWVPYHIRWLAAPVPVLVYAVMTGMQAPAFRAFIMLLFWCFSHVFLRNNKSGNTLSAAAAVILLIQPNQLSDTGFLYSFSCVFFLIISSDFIQRIKKALLLKETFLSDRHRFNLLHLRTKIILSFLAALTAWLCSMELTLCFQSLFTPNAIPAYLLMIPGIMICFLLFLPGLCLSMIPGLVPFTGKLLSGFLLLTAKIAEIFSESCRFYPAPPLWIIVLFLFSLTGIFIFRQKKYLYPCALILFLSGVFSLVEIPSPDAEIAVLRHGGSEPAVIFSDPASGRSYLWNIPSGNTARLVSDYVRSRGIATVEEIHFDSVRQEACGGGVYFLKHYNPRAVYFYEEIPRNAKYAVQIREENPKPGSAPVMKLISGGNKTEASPRISGMEGITVRKTTSENSGTELEIFRHGNLLCRKHYLPGSELILDRFPVTRP